MPLIPRPILPRHITGTSLLAAILRPAAQRRCLVDSAESVKPARNVVKGDKKKKIVPHDYYTEVLFKHGVINVGAKTKKKYIKQNLKNIRYPVAEWNDAFLTKNDDGSKKDFDRSTAALYGPRMVVDPADSSSLLVIDYSQSENTRDLDQEMYGNLITSPVVSRPLPPPTATQPGEWVDGREVITQVQSSAYLKPEEDAAVFGRRLPTVPYPRSSTRPAAVPKVEEGPVTVGYGGIAPKTDELTGDETHGQSRTGWSNHKAHEQSETGQSGRAGWSGTGQSGRAGWSGAGQSGRAGWSNHKTHVSSADRSPVGRAAVNAGSDRAYQIVQLKKEGDLKALPQSPMLNILRPDFRADATKIAPQGAMMLQICPEDLLGQPLVPEKYPSVTTILDVTMAAESRARLDAWRARKIAELGEEGFKLYQQNIFSDGRSFHTAVESVLKGSQIDAVPVPERNEGHWASLRSVFRDVSDVVSVEEPIQHPFLCYKGVTDGVICLDGQQCLVEWKTSSTRKDSAQALYDNPVQVAAYLGAVNFDENFAARKLQLTSGAVVVAYESGEPASVIRFDHNLMRSYWTLWLKRLHAYWRLASVEKSLPMRKRE